MAWWLRTVRVVAATLGLVVWLTLIPAAGAQELAVRIHDLQGAAHVSPFNGQDVSGVEGVVTVERPSSFWMQDLTQTPMRPPPRASWSSGRAWGGWSTWATRCG